MNTKEAIERVRTRFDKWALDNEDLTALQALGLVTAESEDARIRKALIEVFKKKLERGFEWVKYGIPNRSVLDWLEKQKDSVSNAKYIEDVAHAFEDGRKKGIEEERKLAECDKATINGEPIPTENHSVDIPLAEWGEEDEKNRRSLNTKEIKVGDTITYFRNGKKGIMLVSSFDSGIYPRCKWGITVIDGTAYGDWTPGSGPYYAATEKEKQQLYDTMPIEVKNWLKSLPERFNLQPKQEWSGEDRDILLQTAAILKANFDSDEKFEDCDYDCETLAGKLLEMRYRISPSWKPSEEQMKALERASTNKYLSAEQYDILVSLYENLKKLM